MVGRKRVDFELERGGGGEAVGVEMGIGEGGVGGEQGGRWIWIRTCRHC